MEGRIMDIVYKRADGSFVATVNDLPYHITSSDPLFAAAQAAGTGAPMEPVPPQPTAAEELATERAGMVVSRFQAKAALMAAGHLPAVETVIAAADAITQLAWAEAVEMRRTSPMIAGLAGAIGLTDTDLDDLFRAAVLIEA